MKTVDKLKLLVRCGTGPTERIMDLIDKSVKEAYNSGYEAGYDGAADEAYFCARAAYDAGVQDTLDGGKG